MNHKEGRKEDRNKAERGRGWSYQENADVSTCLLAIYMVVLLEMAKAFMSWGLT